MKLSDLIRLRNRLQALTFAPARVKIEELDGQLNQMFTVPMHPNYKTSLDDQLNKLDSIETSISSLDNNITQLIKEIEQELSERTKEFARRGYMINGGYGSNSTNVEMERTGRLLPIRDDTRGEIIVKIRSYTDWRYPALEIGPGDGQWTEHLVAADPLYIVDVHQEFLDSTLSKFNDVYRNRVRPYLLKSHDGPDAFDLSILPEGQFGFIFSWNVFNYFPLMETTAMLKESFKLLKPGGTMMFSFNNCDVPQCAEFAEQGFMAWMTESLLRTTASGIGYEIIAVRRIEEVVTWIELRKPGTLKTVKAHQALGKIMQVTA